MSLLVLFDIDGTLLIGAAAAHRDALHAAIAEVWGVDLSAVHVETGGRTDPEIARSILAAGGIERVRVDERFAAFPAAVVRHYEALVPADLSAHVAPHALAVLDHLESSGSGRLSLVTGNLEPVARLKLGSARIGARFAAGQGGFGSDSAIRSELPPIARARAGAAWNGGAPWPAERTVIVGDTPRDIACARADGDHVVAVATGPFAAGDLGDADVVLEDLSALPEALARYGRA